MASSPTQLDWTAQFAVTSTSSTPSLNGDKILLPPSALEQLLAAAPTSSNDTSTSQLHSTTFDPFNPYSYAAERHARALSQFVQQQLPHPLTFRLVNPGNGRVVYAGIQEFSAEEGHASLSPFLIEALGLLSSTSSPLPNGNRESLEERRTDVGNRSSSHSPLHTLGQVTIHAKWLPKGTYVKLRPLEAGYDPADWRALLERHLRNNFTTLTRGELLRVPPGRDVGDKTEEFEFLIDEFQPHGDGICVIDTDLEVDIEALNEEQARETLRRIAAKSQKGPGAKNSSSLGGDLAFFRPQNSQVVSGEYVDYQITSWDRNQGLLIELQEAGEGEHNLNLFVSPFSKRQRSKPRKDEHAFSDFDVRSPKRIKISPGNVELENAEAIWVSVHDPQNAGASTMKHFSLTIRPYAGDNEAPGDASLEFPKEGESRCAHCHQIVPSQSMVLHHNFCFRNNILCPQGCEQVFQRRSDEWQNHWHCPHDHSHGNSPASLSRHDLVFHTSHSCPNCSYVSESLPQLASHRISICPGKLILCSFCHLEVPQEGDPDIPNAEAILSGLTPHELADGARTTECHLCQKIVRLRDMSTHLKYHNFERLNRDIPRICRNLNCGRTLDGVSKTGDTRANSRMGQGPGNDIGLCSLCFGPLYVSMYDPEGRALKRRVERRYLSQLISGCGKAWCRNEYCKSGRKATGIQSAATTMSSKDALPLIKPFIEGLLSGNGPLHFCVDEASQRRREYASLIVAEEIALPGKSGYDLPWCLAGLEAEGGNLERAREWLLNFAPQISEAQ